MCEAAGFTVCSTDTSNQPAAEKNQDSFVWSLVAVTDLWCAAQVGLLWPVLLKVCDVWSVCV